MYNFESDLAVVVVNKLSDEGMNVEIRFNDVKKNNGLVLRGMSIIDQDKKVSPTVYIDKYYDKVEEGMALDEVANEIVEVYLDSLDGCPDDNIGSNLTDWEFAKEHLTVKLVGIAQNEEWRKDKVVREFNDLLIVPIVLISSDCNGTASVVVTNDLAKIYGVEREEIIDLALGNMSEHRFQNIARALADLGVTEEIIIAMEEENPMYVLTNASKVNGSTAMLDTDVLAELADKLEDDLWILPSSIHEILAIPTLFGNSNDLKEMVKEVNDTQVAPEEILSYSVYKYSREHRTVTIA